MVSVSTMKNLKITKKLLFELLSKKGLNDEKHKNRLEYEWKEFKKYQIITHSDLMEQLKSGKKPNKKILIWYLLGFIDEDPIDEKPEPLIVPGKSPDLDIDFEDDRRQDVIAYIKRRFGENNVAQICNIVTYSIKSAFQDAARIYNVPAQEAISVSKAIDVDNWNETDEYQQYNHIFKFAENLLGQMRNFGKHAAGILITDKPVYTYVPCQYNKDDDIMLTEYSGESIQDLKLLKLDILGLSTLKIIKETIRLVKERHGIDIDINSINYDDPKVFELFGRGLTTGVFQFESASMKGYLQQLKPKNLEDLTAMNALFRPGSIPIINNYIRRRHGREKVEYEHPLMEKVLKSTYGLLIYQEEIIMLAHVASGMSLGRADMLRRYLEKWDSKFKDDVEGKKKWEKEFIDGCINRGLSKSDAEFIWNYLIRQSGYTFNKCVSGDCRIDPAGFYKNRPTIREMYKLKNDKQFAELTGLTGLHNEYNRNGYGQAYSLDEENHLITINTIVDINFAGIRPVFKIFLEDDYVIEVTSNHKFPLPSGEKKSINSGLKEGDYLFVNYKCGIGCKPVLRKIIKIEKAGKKDTYDIEMKAPHHNLSINNVITCNSHSLSYAIIAYQTAWLKTYYPVEFMCASFNSDKTPIDKLMAECKLLGIKVVYPDINKSKENFSIIDDKTIIYGLHSIKNCGVAPAKWIVEHAPYNNIDDFFNKLKADKNASRIINKRVLDSLILCGAFDSLWPNRRELYENYNDWRKKNNSVPFEQFVKKQPFDDYDKHEKLQMMRDLLDVDISGIMLEDCANKIKKLKNMLSKEYKIGIITDVTRKRDKNGNMMAFLTIRDENGSARYPLFSRQFADNARNIIKNKILVFKMGKLKDGSFCVDSISIPDLEHI